MNGTAEISKEEAFDFPEYAALIDHDKKTAYALKRVRRLVETKLVGVEVPAPLGKTLIYEYITRSKPVQAVLLRSAWVRPTEPVDMALPLRVQVLVDGQITLDQPLKAHLWGGAPTPEACICNRWDVEKICICPVAPVVNPSVNRFLFSATMLSEKHEALPDKPLGIFAPNSSLIQIKVVTTRHPASFQARCGITAALYSTATADCGETK